MVNIYRLDVYVASNIVIKFLFYLQRKLNNSLKKEADYIGAQGAGCPSNPKVQKPQLAVQKSEK